MMDSTPKLENLNFSTLTFLFIFSLLFISAALNAQEDRVFAMTQERPIAFLGSDYIELDAKPLGHTLTGYSICVEGIWYEVESHEDPSPKIFDLHPATVYHVSLAYLGTNGQRDTLHNHPFITRSLSSGEIKVYFNSSINPEVSLGYSPENTSGTALRDAIIEKIDSAEQTIDVAAFNINRTEIVQALNRAGNRGVRVRYIAEGSNANSALNTSLAFQVLKRNDPEGIMHHKFLIFDAGDADKSWTLMGSTNLTTQQIATDNNNMLFIQDQGLALIYEMEFEEMWGGSGAQPDLANSRFGENKRDNTPHWLMVGDIPVESYFSPSDNTSFHISNALFEAEKSISFALLLFTFNPLSEIVIQKHHQGLNVRGLIDDIEANGSRYDRLLSNGVNVHPNTVSSVQLHHKYALVDADEMDGNPKVITGSHNWTNRAENHNDENTLIIHSLEITNIFRQEFEARWCESVSEQCFVYTTDYSDPTSFFTAYPNPSDGLFSIRQSEESLEGPYQITVFDSRGIPVKSIYSREGFASQRTINLRGLSPQIYYLQIQAGGHLQTIPLYIQQQ